MKAVDPSQKQWQAIRAINQWHAERSKPIFYLAGYAGSGKTTIVNIAIAAIEGRLRRSLNTILAAYTGKAADVLRNKTGREATTLHKLLYKVITVEGETKFIRHPDSPLRKADLLVIDEASMVPLNIAEMIASYRIPTLVLGDPAQLPPIEGQSVYTKDQPSFFLDEIHRQAIDNPIIRLAEKVREGKRIPFGIYDERVRKVPYNTEAAVYLLENNPQIICGINRRRWKSTRYLRECRGFEGLWPQKGEPIIGCRNEHERGFYNGTQGIVEEILQKEEKFARLRITPDNKIPLELTINPEPFLEHLLGRSIPRIHRTQRTRLSEIDFGYVISCHKAQGSSWPWVTVLDDAYAFGIDGNRWLYTAITRSSSNLVIISDRS